jgi:hypothetical protein
MCVCIMFTINDNDIAKNTIAINIFDAIRKCVNKIHNNYPFFG